MAEAGATARGSDAGRPVGRSAAGRRGGRCDRVDVLGAVVEGSQLGRPREAGVFEAPADLVGGRDGPVGPEGPAGAK